MRIVNYKIISVIMTLCLLISLLSPFSALAAPSNPVVAEVGQVTGVRGDIVHVPVYLDPGDYPFWEYSLNVSYDPAVLELASEMEVTSEIGTASFEFDTATSGVVNVEASNFGSTSFLFDKQNVFTIHFKIKETAASGISNVTIDNGTYVDDEDPIAIPAVTPGMVQVADTGTITIQSSSASAGSTADVAVYLDSASAGVGSYGMDISFNPTALEVSGITGNSGDVFISSYDNTLGSLSTAWADITGGDQLVSGGQELFTIQFKVKETANAGDQLPLMVTNETDLDSFSLTDSDGTEMIKTLHPGKIVVRLTVTASDPTGAGTDGKTKVNVAQTAGTGNTFKYKNFAGTAVSLPSVGDSIGSDYAALPSDGIITAANGDKIAVVEVDAADQVVRFGQTTAVVADDPVTAGGLTVTASDLTGAGTDGKTKVNVAQTAGTGNMFKYKNFAGTAVSLPSVGDSIGSDYAALPSDGIITAANGDKIAVVEVDAADQVVKFGQTTAVVVNEPVTGLAAPANLTAAAGSGQAVLNWNSVTGATYYNIYMSTAAGSYTETPAATVTGATYTFTGLTNNQTYYFVVKAGNAEQLSAYSNEISVTPVAAVNPSKGSSSRGSSSSSSQSITINVQNGAEQNGTVVTTTVIKRTTAADGSKKDEVTFTQEQANKSVEQLKEAGSNSAKIVISDEKDEVAELNVNLPAASTERLAKGEISLEIFTDNTRIVIPNTSLQDLTDQVYFRLVPMKQEEARKEAEQRLQTEQLVRAAAGSSPVEVIGRPMKIETNMQSRAVTLVLPLGDTTLEQAELNQLRIFIEHSDGTKELVTGEIVAYNQAGQLGIRFTVHKFSTFTIVHLQSPANGNNADKLHNAYIQGYEDGTFGPERSITRAEMAAILTRALSQPEKQASKSYTDVSAGHWAMEAIQQVTKAGLMDGYPDASFKPDRTITRAEMAVIAVRTLSAAPSGSVESFPDVTGHWAQTAIDQAQSEGILSGYADGTFRPDQTLTRAEAVAIMNKLLGRGPLNGTEPKWSDVPKEHWAYGAIQEASTDHAYESNAAGEQYVPQP
ncbi:S-layer homology domain-containing protein [Paenibacillus sp. y28]|uniref:S-layer homology domain-containing protein n=1 Tax=Paenibacillus sp. y28 TaxID=3129110 RepID=UPI003019A285